MKATQALLLAGSVLLLTACGAPLTGKYQGTEMGGYGGYYGGQGGSGNQMTLTIIQDGSDVKGQWDNAYQKGDFSGTVDGDVITNVVLTERLSYSGGTGGGSYQTCPLQGTLFHRNGEQIDGTLSAAGGENCAQGQTKTISLRKIQ